MRLVSLLPSATEIVYALGLGDDLVGVTFECEVPAADRAGKTVVVGGTDTHGMSPGEIDAHVRAQLAAGADLYTLHADALSGLDPELILTQGLCRVCALPSGHVVDALDHLGCRADVLSLDPYTLDEVLDSVLAVGAAAGVPERAGDLVGALRDRLAAVAAAVAGRPRPRVAVVEWTDPPFTAGHWIPDLVRAAGGEPVATRPGARSVQVPWSELRDAAPEIVLVTPAASTSTARWRRPRRSPRTSRASRSGRSTPTRWWSGPVRGWSTGWRRSPPCCTPTRCPRRRPARWPGWPDRSLRAGRQRLRRGGPRVEQEPAGPVGADQAGVAQRGGSATPARAADGCCPAVTRRWGGCGVGGPPSTWSGPPDPGRTNQGGTMRSTRTLGAVATVVLAVLLTATGAATATGRPTATALAATTTTPYCGITWGSTAKSGGTLRTASLLTTRTGRHDCYDRLVFEFEGAANGYSVAYGAAWTEGQGLALSPYTAGGALLRVSLREPAVGYPHRSGDHVANVVGYRTLRDVVYGGTFEGYSTFAVGVRAQLPFRVLVLAGPGTHSRIVLDVAHQWQQ
ncbi:ABC transporter substrate-binding protein [Micromonospora sp. CPCC 205711]|uniref:AMIN-like domain-containing (lipo)protein n=1 Tax=Micromonospora sp. CPCC 205547 TaxID=3122400 RepID=UPI002FEE858D